MTWVQQASRRAVASTNRTAQKGPFVSQSKRAARDEFGFWWPVTVRWGDMDALGHVNNCAYFQYLECARIGYFEAMGWDSRDTTPTRKGPIIVSQTFNYRRQLLYPAEVEVGVACREIRNRSFVLAYAVFRRGTDDLYGDGSTVLVWLDFSANTAVQLPPQVREYLIGR